MSDNAVLKLKLKSNTGYSCEATYAKVSPKQWGQVVAVLEGANPFGELAAALKKLLDATNLVHPDAHEAVAAAQETAKLALELAGEAAA